MGMREKVEDAFESVLFASRWLMAPFYLGLVVALLALMAEFIKTIWEVLPQIVELSEAAAVVWVLTLIDLSLAANLLLMVIFSGYENFVSRMSVSAAHPDRPTWMGKIDFSSMKLKLIASIVAISAIELLKAFMSIKTYSDRDLMWLVGIHMTFIVSGVLLALMDWITERGEVPETRREHEGAAPHSGH
ncbi:MAG TPA: TIGR00645 family protein [Rhizomicrobium sp.]